MASEPDPDRLRALEQRLASLRGKPKTDKTSVAKGLSHGELAWRMVIELATGIMVGTAIGYGLDRLFGTLPILLVIFSMLGFAAGVRTMMGTAREVAEKRVAEAAQEGLAALAAKMDTAAQAAYENKVAQAATQSKAAEVANQNKAAPAASDEGN